MVRHHNKSPSLKLKESIIVQSNEKNAEKAMAVSIQQIQMMSHNTNDEPMKAPIFLLPINANKEVNIDFSTNNPTPAGAPSVMLLIESDKPPSPRINFNETLTPKNVEHFRNFREE